MRSVMGHEVMGDTIPLPVISQSFGAQEDQSNTSGHEQNVEE